MIEMTIDNHDISVFGARLLNFSVGGSTITRNMSVANNICKIPSVYSSSVGTRQLMITLVFKPHPVGDNAKNTTLMQRYNNSTINVARFEGYLLSHGTVEITLPDGFVYSAICTAVGTAVLDGTGEQEVAYTFTAIRHKPLQTIPLTGATTTVLCEATTPVYCNITLTADQAYNSITLMGITINNINAGDVIAINGWDNLITCNGINKYGDSDLIDFPVLQPGKNIINNTAITAQGSISYYPVYC